MKLYQLLIHFTHCIWLLTMSVLPVTASAHIRWFVDDASAPIYSFSNDLLSMFIIFGGILFCFICSLIKQHTPPFDFFVAGRKPWILLSVTVALMLLWNSFESVLLAPNLILDTGIQMVLIFVFQAFVAFCCLIPCQFKLAGSALITLTSLLLVTQPFEIMLDYVFEFMAIGMALLLLRPNGQLFEWPAKINPTTEFWALQILRIGFGIQLIILAVHNKLLDPGLGIKFLETHQYNFMLTVGVDSFTNIHFVLAAGVAELCFGLMLLLGTATRTVTGICGCFFVITSALLGIEELIGHIPILGVAAVLLCKNSNAQLLIFMPKRYRLNFN